MTQPKPDRVYVQYLLDVPVDFVATNTGKPTIATRVEYVLYNYEPGDSMAIARLFDAVSNNAEVDWPMPDWLEEMRV